MALQDEVWERLLLIQKTPGLDASFLVDNQGTIVASIGLGVEEEMAAVPVSMAGLGERIAWEMGKGKLKEIYVKGQNGGIVLIPVGVQGILVGLLRTEAKLGMVLFEMMRAVGELEEMLGKASELPEATFSVEEEAIVKGLGEAEAPIEPSRLDFISRLRALLRRPRRDEESGEWMPPLGGVELRL